jgi:hypothetical protein
MSDQTGPTVDEQRTEQSAAADHRPEETGMERRDRFAAGGSWQAVALAALGTALVGTLIHLWSGN